MNRLCTGHYAYTALSALLLSAASLACSSEGSSFGGDGGTGNQSMAGSGNVIAGTSSTGGVPSSAGTSNNTSGSNPGGGNGNTSGSNPGGGNGNTGGSGGDAPVGGSGGAPGVPCPKPAGEICHE